jgi:hypothetical protein
MDQNFKNFVPPYGFSGFLGLGDGVGFAAGGAGGFLNACMGNIGL